MHRPYERMASARILARSLLATYSAENATERSASETLIYCLKTTSQNYHKHRKQLDTDRRFEGETEDEEKRLL
jgi:hypothetical protein